MLLIVVSLLNFIEKLFSLIKFPISFKLSFNPFSKPSLIKGVNEVITSIESDCICSVLSNKITL